jgi:hypothetical protein
MSNPFTHRQSQKARKRYYCDWCGEEIKAGESYDRVNGTDGYDFFSYKMHDECADAATSMKGQSVVDNAHGDMMRGHTHEEGEFADKCPECDRQADSAAEDRATRHL